MGVLEAALGTVFFIVMVLYALGLMGDGEPSGCCCLFLLLMLAGGSGGAASLWAF